MNSLCQKVKNLWLAAPNLFPIAFEIAQVFVLNLIGKPISPISIRKQMELVILTQKA
jgi:hypothetical protein